VCIALYGKPIAKLRSVIRGNLTYMTSVHQRYTGNQPDRQTDGQTDNIW